MSNFPIWPTQSAFSQHFFAKKFSVYLHLDFPFSNLVRYLYIMIADKPIYIGSAIVPADGQNLIF